MAVTLHFNRLDEWAEVEPDEPMLERAVRATLHAAGCAPEGELSVTFLPETEMRDLNRSYRGEDAPTDVLAFDLSGGGEPLGDVYVCPAVARRRAAEWSVAPAEELVRVVIHGVLHSLGYEHPDDEGRQESEMFRLQESVLRVLSRSAEDPPAASE